MHHESNKSKIIGLKLEGRIFPKLIRFTKLSKIRAKLLNVGNNDLNFLPVKEFTKILKFSNEFAQKNNSKLYFVYLPHYYRYTGNNNNDYSFNYKTVINIVDNLNIPIIDLNKELFSKLDDPLSLFPYRMDGHYTKEGHELVAKTIFNKINELEK